MIQSLLSEHKPENNLYLCFELDEKTYAIDSERIMEVMMLPSLSMPQKLPENVIGILNYNGILINVIDIRKILNLPQKSYSATNQLIIIRAEESLFAIITDKVSDFFYSEPSTFQSTSFDVSHSFIKSFYNNNDQIINIFNIAALETLLKNSKDTENAVHYADLFPTDENSKALMQKRSREIAVKTSMNLQIDFFGKDQYITFDVNGHTYCISSDYVKELVNIRNYPITKIPYTPKFVKGIINLKGDFYTVISLKEYIDFNEINDIEEEKVIIFESAELKLGFLVDNVMDIMNIAKDQVYNKNDIKLDSLYVKAEIYEDNRVFNLLNIDKIISDKKLYIE